MVLQQWREEGSLYAVIDAAADPSLVAYFYEQGGNDAYPLFAGTDFSAQAEHGPWLLPTPSQAFVEAHPTLRASKEAMQRHWQSLNNAIYDGEAVWFRYADHRILLPMLTAMTPGKRDALLGPCEQLMIEGQCVTQSQDFIWVPASETPWFHIREHQLAGLYDESRHADILRRHFWQRMEKVMRAHPNPKPVILYTLQQANRDGLVEDVREGVIAGALALQADFTLDSIRAPLMLTDDEFMQVAHWLGKHTDLIGTSLMSVSAHCLLCEKYDRWIEIDVRDEQNQSFKGLKATLKDETGQVKTVTLKDGPTLVQGFAVGEVTLTIENQPWLKAAQSREKLKEGEASKVPAYTGKFFGHKDVKRKHVKLTTGDLCQTDPEQPLPEGHKRGQAQPARLLTDESYVIEVKGYQINVLRIGVFFDGTGNNTRNAQAGLQKVEQWLLETCSDSAQREKELRGCQMGQSPVEGSSANDVTNVGKLFEQYDIAAGPLVAHSYISGIGTRDPIAGENGPEYRSDDTLTQGFDLDFGGENTSIIGKVEVACQQSIVRSINRDLGEILVDVDCIHRIEFDVFGFSRGAAARHFVNVIDQKADHPLVQAMANSPNIPLKAGFDWASRDDVRFTFVGLFDTVVSSYNRSVNIQLKADCAERVVHLTALDEVRKYFPLSRITEDAAGTSTPAHFTELALPGAHSDIGGGYYSRWSLSNPNSDPALIECIELDRFMSVETVTTPDAESSAYQKAKAYAEEKRTLGWVTRINPNLPHGAVPPLGAISLKPYSFQRPEGKNGTGPGKKSVYVEVLMSRVVEGEYSRIPLHMMVEAGRAVGVPFKAWMPDDRALQLEPLCIKRPEADLKALDKLWALSAIEQKVAKNLAHQLSPDVYRALRRDYLHHSASNKGIANPANTNKYESSISKERRKLIGNKEAQR